MATETKSVKVMTNGVDVQALMENIEAFKANPALADFRFYQTNSWLGGGHNRSTIQNFYGAGQEQTQRREPFVLDADEPPLLLGEDNGANPVEYLLHAVTACVTTAMVYHAAARGIRIDELESRTEGDIDLRGFMAIDDTVPVGFQNIRMMFKIKSDAPAEVIRKLVADAPGYSPVFSTLTQGVKVKVGLEN